MVVQFLNQIEGADAETEFVKKLKAQEAAAESKPVKRSTEVSNEIRRIAEQASAHSFDFLTPRARKRRAESTPVPVTKS